MALSDIKINSSFFKFLDERVAVSSLLSVFAAGAMSAILMFLLGSNLSSIEERAGALPWLAAPDTAQEERITIVSVDERSLAELGPWPWSWDLIAELVDKINDAGAQLQIHDILYPAGERAFDDSLLNSVTESERSIIAQLPILQPQAETLRTGRLTNSVNGVACQNEAGVQLFPETRNFIGSPEKLAPVPKGHIVPIIDSDGAVRRIPAMVCVDGRAFPALALAPFFQLVGSGPWQAEIAPAS